MAYRDRALIIDSLGSNWFAQASPSIGVTASASVTPAAPTIRPHLTQLGWSLNNSAGAAAATGKISVKNSSTAGTVYGAWDIGAAAGGFAQDTWSVNIKGKKGKPFFVDSGTPSASATYKVSIAGWFDQLSDG